MISRILNDGCLSRYERKFYRIGIGSTRIEWVFVDQETRKI